MIRRQYRRAQTYRERPVQSLPQCACGRSVGAGRSWPTEAKTNATCLICDVARTLETCEYSYPPKRKKGF